MLKESAQSESLFRLNHVLSDACNVYSYLTEFYFTDSTRYGLIFFKIMNLIEDGFVIRNIFIKICYSIRFIILKKIIPYRVESVK